MDISFERNKYSINIFIGSRPFECPLCKMTFRTSGHKRAHLLVHYRGATREGKNPKGTFEILHDRIVDGALLLPIL